MTVRPLTRAGQRHGATPATPSTAAAPVPATPVEVELAAAQLARYEAVQMERLQMIVDAATLAVEQVGDMQIQVTASQANAAKQVTISSLLLPLLLTWCFEIPVIADAVEAVAGTAQLILGDLLRIHSMFRLLPLSDFGEDALGDLGTLAYAPGPGGGGAGAADAERALVADFLSGALSLGGESSSAPASKSAFAAYCGAISGFMAADPKKLGSTLASKANTLIGAIAPKLSALGTPSPLGVTTSNTPRVAVLRGAQDFVSSHRLALRLQVGAITAYVRSAATTSENLAAVVDLMAPAPMTNNGEPMALLDVRDQFALAFEALLWAKLYHFGVVPTVVNGKVYDGNWIYESSTGLLTDGTQTIPKTLSDYLMVRFYEYASLDRGDADLPKTLTILASFLTNIAGDFAKNATSLQLTEQDAQQALLAE